MNSRLLIGQWRFGGVGSPFGAGLLNIRRDLSRATRPDRGGRRTHQHCLDSRRRIGIGEQSVIRDVIDIDIDNVTVTATLEADRCDGPPLDITIAPPGAHGMAYIPAIT
ncbi:hypothetical protein [Nocardia sp. NPDC051463]|uniref:hypothetical protein n=1 Tax=Nocardia sp. NPDC051463 TaxID=3154845 RepID=UPI003419AF32